MPVYYLYRHVRLDKNEVFYIGIGTVPTENILIQLGHTDRAYYRRAYETKKSRNQHWKNIVAKTNYKIEIIFETSSIAEIIEKEIEFISLYRNTLCNICSGGLGITSYKHTLEAREKIGAASRGKKQTEQQKRGSTLAKLKKISMFDKNGVYLMTFNSLTEGAKFVKGDFKNISSCALGRRPTAYKYIWRYGEDKELLNKELVG